MITLSGNRGQYFSVMVLTNLAERHLMLEGSGYLVPYSSGNGISNG